MPLPEPIVNTPTAAYAGLTSEDLLQARDVLAKRRLSGVSWVRYADGSGSGYRTDAEIATEIASIDAEIARRAGGAAPPSTILVASSKGLEAT